MKKITPCLLYFNGNALEAFRFYKSIFKNKAKLTETHKRGGKVLFGAFQLFGQDILFVNGGPKCKLSPAISLFLSCADQREVDYYWSRLSKGGEEVACGWLVDKYGLSWQVIPVQLMQLMESKDKKKAERAFQAMIKMVKIDVAELQRAAKGTGKKR